MYGVSSSARVTVAASPAGKPRKAASRARR
jgi:hypothetical protein